MGRGHRPGGIGEGPDGRRDGAGRQGWRWRPGRDTWLWRTGLLLLVAAYPLYTSGDPHPAARPADRERATRSAAPGPSSPSSSQPATSQGATMNAEQSELEARLRQAVVGELKQFERVVDPAAVSFEYLSAESVPGYTVFRANYTAAGSKEPGYLGGIVAPGGVPEFSRYLAMGRVHDAWTKGGGALPDPTTVARVTVFLFNPRMPAEPLLTRAEIDALAARVDGRPVEPPVSIEVDGKAAVRFWQLSGPGIERVVVVPGSGRMTQVKLESIADVGKGG